MKSKVAKRNLFDVVQLNGEKMEGFNETSAE